MIQENKITTLLLVLSEAKNGFTDENKFHFQILRHSTFHQSCSAEPVVDSSFVKPGKYFYILVNQIS